MKLAELLDPICSADAAEKHSTLKERLERGNYREVYTGDIDTETDNITIPESYFSPESIVFLGYDTDFTKRTMFEEFSRKRQEPTKTSVYSMPVSKGPELDDLVELPVERSDGAITFVRNLLFRNYDYVQGDHSDPIALYVKADGQGNKYFALKRQIAQAVEVIEKRLALRCDPFVPLSEPRAKIYERVLSQLKPLVQ